MPLSQFEKDKRTALRTRKLIDCEHRINPIKCWGTLHVHQDYDLNLLRRGISDAHRRGHLPAAFVKIEKSRRGKRPHLHFLWHDVQNRKELRAVIAKLLARQGVASNRFRFSAEQIDETDKVFPYFCKATTNFASEARSVFSVGKFFHKPTKGILAKTPAQIWNSKIERIAHDPVAFYCVWQGIVTPEQVANPRWLSYWNRKGRALQEPLVPDEWRDESS